MTSPNHLTPEQKHSFVQLVFERDSAFAEACRAFRISRQTGYKWLGRYRQVGLSGLAEQSRRPHDSPHATAAVWVERLRLARRRRKRWGAKKLRAWLQGQHPRSFGEHVGTALAPARLVTLPAVAAAGAGSCVASAPASASSQ
jgi:transposase-like protein